MSYVDQTSRKNPLSIAAVVGVHLAVGYALVSGFAITVIRNIDHIPIVVPVNDPPPPRPHPIDIKQTKQEVNPNPIPIPDPRPTMPDPIVKLGDPGQIDVSPTGSGTGEIKVPTIEPVRPSLASGAVPERNWRNWITTEDYPPAAIRENVQGSVGISAVIGTDGRVRSCLVIQSSGSKILDDATCRLYSARGRFTPAKDADGNLTTAQRTDHYRWQIPNE